MRIKAVFFDAGNTLVRPHPSLGYWYARIAARYGRRVTAAGIERKFWKMVEDKGGLGTLGRQARFHHEKEWWRTRVRDLFDLYGGVDRFDPFFEELFDRFGASSTWRVLPGVTATLVRLHREGMRLGIISNWDHRLLGIADGLGLSGLVDVVVPSGLFGTAKPHPSIFKKALLMLGVRAEESLHVGDSLEEDYHGAQRVGMHALWLAPPQQKARGVSRIGSLYEIHRWLRCS